MPRSLVLHAAVKDGRASRCADTGPAASAEATACAVSGLGELQELAVLNGEAEDDAFNRLISIAGLAAREANWLRAWYRYLRQATISFGIGTAVDALVNAPRVARGMINLFVARHDPRVLDQHRQAP